MLVSLSTRGGREHIKYIKYIHVHVKLLSFYVAPQDSAVTSLPWSLPPVRRSLFLT